MDLSINLDAMGKCMMCGSESHRRKLCYDCSERRSNACSIINQNKKRILSLCSGRTRYDEEWIYKFRLYVNNIEAGLDILSEFNRADIEIYSNYKLNRKKTV